MIKRTLCLALVVGLASAGLIFAGTAVMSRIGAASAAQLPALIAEGSGEDSVTSSLPADSENRDPGQDDKTGAPAAGSAHSAVAPGSAASSAASGTGPAQPAADPSVKPGPAVKVTIAELLANPSGYLGRLVAGAGRVTVLSSDKLLINDGTGQIIVDLDDDVSVKIANGILVGVVGKLARDDGGAFDIDALTVTGIGATATGQPADDDPPPPTPRPGCDDDDCGPDDRARPPLAPSGGCDDDGDGDFDDDCGDDQDDIDDDDDLDDAIDDDQDDSDDDDNLDDDSDDDSEDDGEDDSDDD